LNSSVSTGDDINIHSLLEALPADTLRTIYKDEPRIVFSALVGIFSDERFDSIRSLVEMLLHSFIETDDQEQLLYVAVTNLLQEFGKGNISDVNVEVCLKALIKASSKFDSLKTVLASNGVIKHLRTLIAMYGTGSFYDVFITRYAKHNMEFIVDGIVSNNIEIDDDVLTVLDSQLYQYMFRNYNPSSIPKQVMNHVLSDPIVLKDVIRVRPDMKDRAVKHAHKENEYTALLWSMDIQTIHETFVSLELSYKGTIIEDILNMDYEGYVPALSVLSVFVKDGNLALLYAIKDSFVGPDKAKGFDPLRLHELINDVL